MTIWEAFCVEMSYTPIAALQNVDNEEYLHEEMVSQRLNTIWKGPKLMSDE